MVTDVDGRYTLKIEPSDKILVISYIGMKSAEVKVPKNGFLDVMLRSESLSLDEVVVTGYGNFSKSSFTGSANTLRADMLKNVPVSGCLSSDDVTKPCINNCCAHASCMPHIHNNTIHITFKLLID